MGWLEVMLDFLSLIFVFLIILALAYFTTKLVASSSLKKMKNKNMKVFEALTIAPQKSLQLVKIGKKVILLGITKENITRLETFEQDELEISEEQIDNSLLTFQDVFNKTLNKTKDDKNNNKDSKKKKVN